MTRVERTEPFSSRALLADFMLDKEQTFLFPYHSCEIDRQREEHKKADQYPTIEYKYNLRWFAFDITGAHMFQGKARPVLVDDVYLAPSGCLRMGNPCIEEGCAYKIGELKRVYRTNKK